MLDQLLTLALLPLALAACPCPPAPATATVCGSNNKTYPSACDLDCTAPPGVAAAHPGPCHTEDAAPGRPISALEERRKYEECQRERQCYSVSSSACGVDSRSRHMCVGNCKCGCMGLQTSGLDFVRWRQCYRGRDCVGKWRACRGRCRTGERECEDRCWMDEEWCRCECALQVDGTPSSTTTSTYPRQWLITLFLTTAGLFLPRGKQL